MAGRPPKEKSFANMLNIAVKEAVKGSDKTKLRAVADKLLECAMNGEGWAIKEIADRLDGKPMQQMDLEHSGGVAVILSRDDADL